MTVLIVIAAVWLACFAVMVIGLTGARFSSRISRELYGAPPAALVLDPAHGGPRQPDAIAPAA